MLIPGENGLPGLSAVGRHQDAPTRVSARRRSSPGRQVEALRILRVHGQAVRAVRALGQGDARPVLGPVGGPVERAVARVPDLAAFAPARHHEVERAVGGAGDTPRERLGGRETAVLRRPGLPVIGRLEDPATETARVEGTRPLRARRIQQDVGGGRLGHARSRARPGQTPVPRHAHPALELVGVGVAPNLRPRKVVSRAERAPHEARHLRIEGHPVGRVAPAQGNALDRARPGLSSVLAAKEADVGVRDEDALGIRRIPVDAVAVRDVETAAHPTAFASPRGVDLSPGLPAVGGAVSAEEVGDEADVGIAGRHRQVVGRVEPDRVAVGGRALLDPRGLEVRGRPIGLFVDDGPGAAAVGGLRDAVELGAVRGAPQPPQASVGHETALRRRGHGPQARPRILRVTPAFALAKARGCA